MSDEAPVTLWRYARRNDDQYRGWFVAHLDSSGFFAVASDYGNYVFHWPAAGWGRSYPSFREFFLSCGDDYIASKLSYGWPYEFQAHDTEERVRERILELRREGFLSAEEARVDWDNSSIDSEMAFSQFLDTTTISDACELARYETAPRLKYWVQNVLPRLRDAIEEDLQREKDACE